MRDFWIASLKKKKWQLAIDQGKCMAKIISPCQQTVQNDNTSHNANNILPIKKSKVAVTSSQSDVTVYDASTCDGLKTNNHGSLNVMNDRFSSDEMEYGDLGSSDDSLQDKINKISNSPAGSQFVDPMPKPGTSY